MAMSLVGQFLGEEVTPDVRKLLLQALSAIGEAKGVREFAFNRFNLVVDTHRGTVSLQDDLDASENGEVEMSIPEFAAALTR